MNDESGIIRYWDVFPKSIRISQGGDGHAIPLSIRGNVNFPEFVSSNPEVAFVDPGGVLHCGWNKGNAMITAYILTETGQMSLRHMAVEVREQSWFSNHPDFISSDINGVQGRVINAVNTSGVSFATVEIRRNETGSTLVRTVTDESGFFGLTLPPGDYFAIASAPDYIDWHGWITVSSDTQGLQIVMSPILNGQMARIVLQWGQNPRDLDSHLTGPRTDGSRFHVFYSHAYEQDGAELDVDDTSSYGPETITIHRLIPGTYRYCVHDYTNRSSNPSFGLAGSSATVKVFMEDDEEHTFNVPDSPGTVWNVFDVDGTTGLIIPRNVMTHQSQPSEVGRVDME